LFLYSVLYHIYQKAGFYTNVRYHIDHTAVPELQELFLYSVLYHIDHMAVPGLQEWCLHNMSLCCGHLQR
jgi:hypothetical protein